MVKLSLIFLFISNLLYAQFVDKNPDRISLVPVLRSVVESRPFDMEAWQNLFQYYIEAGKPDSANHVAKASLEYFPQSRALLGFYAYAFWEARDYAHSLPFVEKLHELEPTAQMKTALAAAFRNTGVEESHLEQWTKAAVHFEKALALDPKSRDLHHATAYALTRAGSHQKALKVIDRGFALYPDSKELLQIQKYVMIQKQDYGALEEKVKAFVDRNPGDKEARLELNQIYQARGNYHSALTDLNTLKAQFPGDIRIAEELSAVQHAVGDYEKERQSYEDMLKRHPNADTLLLKIGKTYDLEGKFPEARTYYTRYLAVRPDDAAARAGIAGVYEKEKKLDSALLVYNALLEKKPHHRLSLQKIGELNEALGRLDAALAGYERWARDASALIEPLIGQGRVLEKMGKTGSAMEKYTLAESWGGSGFTAFRLFLMHKQAGRTKAAAAFQRLALQRQVREIQQEERIFRAAAQAESGHLPFQAPSDSLAAKADSLKSRRGLARALTHEWIPSGRDTSLENTLLDLLAEMPSAPVVHELLAGGYLSQRNFQQALASYEKLLSINPLSLEGQQGQALCYEKLGKLDSALFVLERIVEMNLSDSRPYGPAVRGAEKAGKLAFLAERWEQLLRANKTQNELKKNLIYVWNRLGRNDKVIALTETKETQE